MSKKVITPAPEDFCKAIERFKKSVEEATERFNNFTSVVRCKDCKYAAMDMCCNHPIEWDNGESRNHCNPDWYCADGERK